MKIASMILGIVVGVLAILFSFFMLLGGYAFSYITPKTLEKEILEPSEIIVDGKVIDYEEFDPVESAKQGGLFFFIAGGFIAFAGILGVVGGLFVKRKRILAGVLMLISSVMLLVSFFASLLFIPLLIGGIFALIKDKKEIIKDYKLKQQVS